MWSRSVFLGVAVLFGGFMLAGCAQVISPPHLKPLPAQLRVTLAKKGMEDSAPIFVRIFKEESLLEVWKAKADGRYYHLKSYPVCKWSGALGPKLKQGDKQAPEGFYNVVSGNMNPNSKYHLSFNLGYPNVYDRSHGRTGKHLMVHGDCKSAGCYAMTDALMEEIYLLARDAFIGGQDIIPVHAFPFRLTRANLQRHRRSKWYRFWKNLKPGYDHFEVHKTLPKVDVCSKRYVINASFIDPAADVDPNVRCPRYRTIVPGPRPLHNPQLMVKAPAAPVASAMSAQPSLLHAGVGSVSPKPVELRPSSVARSSLSQQATEPAAREATVLSAPPAPVPVVGAPAPVSVSPQHASGAPSMPESYALEQGVAFPSAALPPEPQMESRSLPTSLDEARHIMFGDALGASSPGLEK